MGIGLKISLGVVVAGLVLALFMPRDAPMVLGWLLVVVALVWFVLHRWVHRPMHAIASFGQALVRGESPPPLVRVGQDWGAVVGAMYGLAAQRDRDAKALAAAAGVHKELADKLRQTEERYALAIRGASDGLWEWNLDSDAMHLSPRWKNMLGFTDQQIPDSFTAWKSRIYPGDLPAVEAQIRAHLAGEVERFESEHRVVHRDGSYRWVLARGVALRHNDGTAYRLVGIDSDISQFKRLEDMMMHIAEGTAGALGNEFFRVLVRHFALALGVRMAFVTECFGYPPDRVQAMACWCDGAYLDDLAYDLAGAPCEGVFASGEMRFHPRDVETLFPIERGEGFESYLGLPIRDPRGKLVGHLAFFDNKPMSNSILVTSIYRIFTARAGAEIARVRAERAVLALADTLQEMHAGQASTLRELILGNDAAASRSG